MARPKERYKLTSLQLCCFYVISNTWATYSSYELAKKLKKKSPKVRAACVSLYLHGYISCIENADGKFKWMKQTNIRKKPVTVTEYVPLNSWNDYS